MTFLQILSEAEQKAFDLPPEFTSDERKRFFHISQWLEKLVHSFITPTNQVGFVLLHGYFRATKRMFSPRLFHQKDAEYVAFKLGVDYEQVDLSQYNRQTVSRQVQSLLEKRKFSKYDSQCEAKLMEEASVLIERQLRPKIILAELVDYLIKQRIVVPKYSVFARIITTSMNTYEKNLFQLVEDHITDDQKELLNRLLDTKSLQDEDKLSIPVRYVLTPLKKINQSLKPKKINQGIQDFQQLQGIYEPLDNLIKSLGMTSEAIRYYAHTVLKSDVYDLTRKDDEKQYLYLSCFTVHQYFKQHDALVDILLRAVQSNLNIAEKEYKLRFFEETKERVKETHKMIHEYKNQHDTLTTIQQIVHAEEWSDKEKIDKVKVLVPADKAEDVATTVLKAVQNQVERTNQDDLYYEILQKNSRKLQNRVSNIVKTLRFHHTTSNQPLLDAIRYYRKKDGDVGGKAPVDFLTEKEQKMVYNREEELRISLYKVFLFTHIANGIKSGELNLKDSYKYRSFDEYLIDKELWQANKDTYLKKAGLKPFSDCNSVLKKLAKILNNGYRKTNRRINKGTNKHVYFDDDGVLHINTPKLSKVRTRSVSELFPTDRYISLLEILSTVHQESQFLEAFVEWKTKYTKRKPAIKTFLAGIMGYGCNLGIPKMAKISKGVNEYELEDATNWYFTLENILAANDRIIDLTERLPLTRFLYNQTKQTHTSSDGQKYNVRYDSLNANRSFKYAGHGMAASAYEFIDNRHLLFYSTVISSSEREAAYVIDGLLHNTIVKSDIHSTDTHGYTEMIFATTHLLGFSFAPRIKKFKKQRLYTFKKIKQYEKLGYKILPRKYVKTAFIKRYWDDILRLICTLKFREVTASQLFKRLSSYSKNHPLYRAIKAFGQIIKSIFILRYLNEVELRQAIRSDRRSRNN